MQKHPSPQIGDLFNRLNEELREKERVYVSYAEDRSDPRQTATQKLVERNVAAVRVEGARQEIAELVLHMDILYDEKLSILRTIGYATTFPSEQDEIDKLGIREGTEVKLGRFAIRVLSVEMMLFGGASGGVHRALFLRVSGQADRAGDFGYRIVPLDANGNPSRLTVLSSSESA